ncbi:MAG: hypothetical protein WDM76_00165 [Limisphaerales bacterium]
MLTLAVLFSGCKTDEQSKQDKTVSALRIHLQVPTASMSQTITVLRDNPVLVNIGPDPVLTEANIQAAKVIEPLGGFAIAIKFNESGIWLLEQYSAANPGKHFAIFGQWGEKLANGRWLAAPLINGRLADGVLTFTPDCSREEADQLVLGLNNVATKIRKGMLK